MTDRIRRAMPVVAGLTVVLIAGPAVTQGNIDAGKTPAQIFSNTCSACHKRPQDLKRASASFLRQHYSTGSAEASAMAGYLAAVGADSKAADQRKERAKAQQERIKAQQEKAKAAQAQTTQAQTQQSPAVKGRRTTTAEAAKEAPEPVSETREPAAFMPETPAVPALEPFEE